MDVLEFLKGTEFWPEMSFFDGKFLFFETSEEKPSSIVVERRLRNYGMQTILNRVQGVIFGRPNGYSDEEKERLRKVVLRIITDEFGRKDIPIVLDFDAGHTDPQCIVPFGILTLIDSEKGEISLMESVFDEA
jgi:muramoyltetrapeptide carboxypeptidase LdcA involved in peptidoglycan recycling